MKENKQSLMKLFSLLLKDRAKLENDVKEISPDMLKFFTRKELIEMIVHIHHGNVPKEHNLTEMENKELLQLIGDDLCIISFVTGLWSKEVSSFPTVSEVKTIDSNSIDKQSNSSVPNLQGTSVKKEEPKPNEAKPVIAEKPSLNSKWF